MHLFRNQKSKIKNQKHALVTSGDSAQALSPQGKEGAKIDGRRLWGRFWRSPAAVLGLILTLFFLLMALLADQIALGDPFKSRGVPFEPPSSAFWFGTDNLGRDVFSGVVYGARTSLLVGISVASASLLIGTLVGGVAGFFGKWVDDLLMRFTELIQVMPRFFLALVVVALFGANLMKKIARR